MGSSDADLALIKQIQPVVSGIGTVIGGLGAILSLIARGGCFQLIRQPQARNPRPVPDGSGVSSFGGPRGGSSDTNRPGHDRNDRVPGLRSGAKGTRTPDPHTARVCALTAAP